MRVGKGRLGVAALGLAAALACGDVGPTVPLPEYRAEAGASQGGSSGSGSDGATPDQDASETPDVTYAFDGFARPDGYSDAAACPDDDGDGFTRCGGDCNDHDSMVNPCAYDTDDPTDPYGHDGVDNDCDGLVDDLVTCEAGLVSGHDSDPGHYARASDLCDSPLCPRLVGAAWVGPSDPSARRVTGHMGNSGQFGPRQGKLMTFLSTGVADDLIDDPNHTTGDGTDFGTTFTNPAPAKAHQIENPCNGAVMDETPTDPAVRDYTELRLTINAPINANAFTFDFAFFSEEYPAYVCRGYDDSFDAVLTSKMYPIGADMAYDGTGHRVDVNNAFFPDCNTATLAWGYGYAHTCANPVTLLGGTGYELAYTGSAGRDGAGNGDHGSGGSDWLSATAPVDAGETFTLRLVLFDEQDGLLDSAVLVDHFRWRSLSNDIVLTP